MFLFEKSGWRVTPIRLGREWSRGTFSVGPLIDYLPAFLHDIHLYKWNCFILSILYNTKEHFEQRKRLDPKAFKGRWRVVVVPEGNWLNTEKIFRKFPFSRLEFYFMIQCQRVTNDHIAEGSWYAPLY